MQLSMCICSLFFSFFFFNCNGILPQIVKGLLLINEYTLLVASCVFTLYIFELIIIANKTRLLPF